MKVAIGSRPYDGPWGGGNRFVTALCDALQRAGHSVVHSLSDADIDIILIVDPRMRSPNVAFGPGAVMRYLSWKNPNAIVVHRINECDERKNEPFINDKLVRANLVADVTVFVGGWMKDLPVWRRHLRSPHFVIHNGADTTIFNRRYFVPWEGQGPFKLVTHHWGYHPMKGLDVYQAIGRLIGRDTSTNKIQLTYIGNLPAGMSLDSIRYVAPLNGEALAAELSAHHAYVTGSINEPGGNHQNEGALCGLPLLYRDSGCMPEYCEGFGVPFAGPGDVEEALHKLKRDYRQLVARMPAYPWTAKRMTTEWLALFEQLHKDSDVLRATRNLWRDPIKALVKQVSF